MAAPLCTGNGPTLTFASDTKLDLFVQDTKCKHGKINS